MATVRSIPVALGALVLSAAVAPLTAQRPAPDVIREALEQLRANRADSARTLLLAVFDTGATLAALNDRQQRCTGRRAPGAAPSGR